MGTAELEYAPQWISEGSTSKLEKAKEVMKTALFVTSAQLQR
jgi:hypothetical protein